MSAVSLVILIWGQSWIARIQEASQLLRPQAISIALENGAEIRILGMLIIAVEPQVLQRMLRTSLLSVVSTLVLSLVSTRLAESLERFFGQISIHVITAGK